MTTRPDRRSEQPVSGEMVRRSETAVRRIGDGELPSAWLDALLGASVELPFDSGVEAVGRTLLDALASALPNCAIGLCIAAASHEGSQIVLRKTPDGVGPGEASGPSRLFTDWPHERVLSIAGDPEGSTLHCASDAPLSDDGPEARLLDRAAAVVASALRSTRGLLVANRAARELAALKAQVIQSEKLASLGQIAAGVVHELNNPLTSIVAYSDYLRKKAERDGADASDVERLRRIGEAADRILRFSRDLVAYARPSSEIPAPVAIHAVIEQALVFCEHVLEQSGVAIERRYAATIAPVRGVPGQLTQVFVNLITNACHAMDGGGRLTIETSLAVDSVRVAVTDTGHGIAQDHLARIFDPFFTTKTEGRGTGLGLSIVHNIVTSHGGDIVAESEPGRGTSFVLALPLAAIPESDPPIGSDVGSDSTSES
jgi:two-component system NtrC family sensor kinase